MGQAVGVLTTVSSATNVVLTRVSVRKHRVTGTVAQTILLPPVADLELGVEYVFFNRSTAPLTVADASNANGMTIATLTSNRITLVDKTGNGVWIMG